MKRRALLVLVTAGLLAGGCTVVHRPSAGTPASGSTEGVRFWPPEDPRIELVRVLGLRGDLARGSVTAWLRGGRHEPLFTRPYGVAWDGGDILVADPGAGRVLRIGAGGGLSRSPEGLLGSPTFVAACGAGIVVSDPPAGRVALLDHKLRLVRWLASDLQRPTGVACLAGRVYVVETAAHRLVELADGEAATVMGARGNGPGLFNFPTALAADGDTLWVGDTLNFRLVHLDPVSGKVLGSFGTLGDTAGQMPRLKDVAVDARGRLWVTDALLDQVALYTRRGEYLMSIGHNGTAPGEFGFPAGVAAAADGRVAVADSFNRRLQVFAPIPEEVTP